jgi:putative transposase
LNPAQRADLLFAVAQRRISRHGFWKVWWRAVAWLSRGRELVGWSMSAAMTAQLVTDMLMMAIWRRGKFDIERKKVASKRWFEGTKSSA